MRRRPGGWSLLVFRPPTAPFLPALMTTRGAGRGAPPKRPPLTDSADVGCPPIRHTDDAWQRAERRASITTLRRDTTRSRGATGRPAARRPRRRPPPRR